MRRSKMRMILVSMLMVITTGISAQEKPTQWNLSNSIEYALKNNIQIQKSKITLEQNVVSTKQAKAQLFPNLTGSINQNLSNTPLLVDGGSSSTYSGSYGINASLLLFDGGKTLRNIRQQKLLEEIGQYNVQYSQKSIQFSILQAYLQILYAAESVTIDSATVEVSKYQFERGGNLLKAGSISKVDLAKLVSQLSSDKYLLMVAQNTLETQKLSLKQLLELTVQDQLRISIPALTDVDILKPLPVLQSVYETSLNVMPQLKSSKLNIQVAGLDTEMALAGYLPKVNLNASAGTNHSTASGMNFNNQLQNGFNEGIGLSVSIPIFNNRSTKSAVETSRLSEQTSRLNLQEAEKSLLTEVESSYQDALSAQSQYIAASEKVKALQTSYDLIEQQFNLGLKNTLELLTEKNNLLSARQSMIQAKYLSIMNVQMLNIYQDLPLEIQ
jgi:outer membrane protein